MGRKSELLSVKRRNILPQTLQISRKSLIYPTFAAQFIAMIIHPGTIQELPVYDENDKGYMLGSEEESAWIMRYEAGETPFEVGQTIKVFTFFNENKELEATTKFPLIQVGEIGAFRISTVNDLGGFVDIGTKRDILIPAREQREQLEAGRMAVLILQYDDKNRRLFGSTKVISYLSNHDADYERGQEVECQIADKIEIGRRVIINGRHYGAMFRQEMLRKVHEGEKVKAYIRKVEGKDIVVSMQREGMELLEDCKEKLMNYLELNGGYVRLNDETDPEEIKVRLRMSKKSFKKAAGMLFREGKVLLTKLGVKINKTGKMPEDIPQAWQERQDDDYARGYSRPPERNTEGKKNPRRKIEDDEQQDEERPFGGSDEQDEFMRRNNRGGSDRPQRSGDRPQRRSNEGSSSQGGEDRPRRFNTHSPNSSRPPFKRNDSEGGERPRYRDDRSQGGDDRPRRYNSDNQGGDRPRPFNRDNQGGDRPYRRNDSEGGDRPRYRDDRSQGGDRPRPYNRDNQGGDRPYRRNDSEGGDRPRYRDDRSQGGDRPRPYNRDNQGGDRPYRRNDSEGGDRPRPYNRDNQGGDRPYRRSDSDGGDRPRPYNRDNQGGDRPYRRNDSEGGDRPRYRDDRSQGGDDRPRRYSGGQGDRPFRRNDSEGGDRPVRRYNSEGGDDRPKRFSSDRGRDGDRPFSKGRARTRDERPGASRPGGNRRKDDSKDKKSNSAPRKAKSKPTSHRKGPKKSR